MLRSPTITYQVAPGAIIATGDSGPFILPVQDWESFVVGLTIASAGGTTPTADFYLQTLGPDGNYYDVYHWAQQTGNTTANHQIFVAVSMQARSLVGDVGSKTVAANTLGVPPLSNTFKIAWTIGGTSPTFTPTFNFYLQEEDRGGL